MLKIDPDFQHVIPPLTNEEFKQLEQNILSMHRCRDAILVWNGVIVDGHSRYAICQQHDILFEISKIHFTSKRDALIWIAENQLGRRNLTDAARIELACCKVDMLRHKARENQSAAGGNMKKEKELVDKPLDVRKEIAAAAGIGEQRVYRYMKVVGEGRPELIEQVRTGEVKIDAAYKQLKMKTKVVREIYDDKDVRYKNSLFCYDNVLVHMDRIGKLYRFIDEAVLLAGVDGIKGMGSVRKRLEGQLGVVEQCVMGFMG